MPTSITVAPGANVIGCDHGGAADGGYQDVAFTADGGQVGSLGMADGDGGVFMEQHQRHGLADDIAASHDDGAHTGDLDFVTFQHLDNAGGCTRSRTGTSCSQVADVAGMETVDIFFGRNGQQDALGIDLRWQRHLHEDTVDLGPAIELVDDGEEFFRCDILGRREGFAVDTEIVGCLDFVADVDLGGGIVTGQDDGETGRPLEGSEFFDARAALVLDFIADAIAVEDQGHVLLI